MMKALGIVLAGGNSKRMGGLSEKRAVAAMPVACNYRAIDFVLSNLTNSGIGKVAVLTQYNSRSLNEHLNASKWWGFGSKQGGLYVFNPTITPSSTNWYRGTADALYQNIAFLEEAHEPYVVIVSGDGIYKLDFSKVLEYHIRKNSDITVVCKDLPEEDDISRFGVVRVNEDSRITEFEEKPLSAESRKISCGIYIIRRRLLIELLEKCIADDRYDFVNDILIKYRNHKRIYAYNMEGYWNNISSIESYYRTNMDFLKEDVRTFFLAQEPHILSRENDFPSAKFNRGCNIKNSLISSGCILNGAVESSLLFRRVFVGSNTVIRNSIILGDVYIDDNCTIENCIVEARSTITAGTVLQGQPDHIEFVARTANRYAL